jgi:hypothetical protein
MKKAVIAPLLFCMSVAYANESESWLVVTAGSYHTNRDIAHAKNFNEANFGVGLEYKLDRNWRLSGGYYKNSYHNDTFYAGAIWLPLQSQDGVVKAGIQAGLLTGYPQYNRGVGPGAAGVIMFEGKKVGLNLMFIPAAEKSGSSVIGLQLKMRI